MTENDEERLQVFERKVARKSKMNMCEKLWYRRIVCCGIDVVKVKQAYRVGWYGYEPDVQAKKDRF